MWFLPRAHFKGLARPALCTFRKRFAANHTEVSVADLGHWDESTKSVMPLSREPLLVGLASSETDRHPVFEDDLWRICRQLLRPHRLVTRTVGYSLKIEPTVQYRWLHGIGDGAFPHPNMYASVTARRIAIAQRIHQGLTQRGTATATSTRAAHTNGMTAPQIKSNSR